MLDDVLVAAPSVGFVLIAAWLAWNGGHWRWNPPRYDDDGDEGA